MNEDAAYEILERVSSFLGDYADIVDGDHGEQKPNKAMKLQTEVEEILTWLEKF